MVSTTAVKHYFSVDHSIIGLLNYSRGGGYTFFMVSKLCSRHSVKQGRKSLIASKLKGTSEDRSIDTQHHKE